LKNYNKINNTKKTQKKKKKKTLKQKVRSCPFKDKYFKITLRPTRATHVASTTAIVGSTAFSVTTPTSIAKQTGRKNKQLFNASKKIERIPTLIFYNNFTIS
jgi:hypothetical protein